MLPIETPRKNSGVATASMVMGILSCTLIPLLLTIPAIILGIVGIQKVNQTNGALGGKGFAITGIVTGAVGIVTGGISCMVIAAILFPTLKVAKDRAVETRNTAVAKQLALACNLYSAENDGAFPNQLEDLLPNYLNDPKSLNYKTVTGKTKPFNYVPGHRQSGPSNGVLIYTDANAKGERIVVHVSSFVDTIDEAKFQRQLKLKSRPKKTVTASLNKPAITKPTIKKPIEKPQPRSVTPPASTVPDPTPKPIITKIWEVKRIEVNNKEDSGEAGAYWILREDGTFSIVKKSKKSDGTWSWKDDVLKMKITNGPTLEGETKLENDSLIVTSQRGDEEIVLSFVDSKLTREPTEPRTATGLPQKPQKQPEPSLVQTILAADSMLKMIKPLREIEQLQPDSLTTQQRQELLAALTDKSKLNNDRLNSQINLISIWLSPDSSIATTMAKSPDNKIAANAYAELIKRGINPGKDFQTKIENNIFRSSLSRACLTPQRQQHFTEDRVLKLFFSQPNLPRYQIGLAILNKVGTQKCVGPIEAAAEKLSDRDKRTFLAHSIPLRRRLTK